MERIQRTIADMLGEQAWPELPPDASVAAAQDAMARDGVDCVLVVEASVLIGIFTSRDFLLKVAAEGRLPADIPLGDVMTRDPVALKRHDCVTYAINNMARRAFRQLPVIDDERRPVGLLRIWDVIGHLSDVFEEINGTPPERPTENIWIDIGGGG